MYVLIALLPDLQFLYIPAGIFFLLPTSYVCCDSCMPEEREPPSANRRRVHLDDKCQDFMEIKQEEDEVEKEDFATLDIKKKKKKKQPSKGVNGLDGDSGRRRSGSSSSSGKKRNRPHRSRTASQEPEEEKEALNFGQLLSKSQTTVV